MARKSALFFFSCFLMISTWPTADGGPLAYAACQAGCAGIVVVCFSAAGFTFGVVPGSVIAATPALAACNAAFASCSATCATIGLLAPTP